MVADYLRSLSESEAEFTRLGAQQQQVQAGIMFDALATRDRFGISYWDAAILEAGRSLGCDVVLSEDLSHGDDYGGVRVENPFRT